MYIFKTYLNIIYMQYQADIEQLIEFLFFFTTILVAEFD
jgi:hypothetical protein